MQAFSMLNKTRHRVRVSAFSKLKEEVLGKTYELSVALVDEDESRNITLKTKEKDKPSNVLSFPLSEHSGEIVLCPDHTDGYTLEYLFIHGLLHLKGLQHGVTMEHEENRLLQKFGFQALG